MPGTNNAKIGLGTAITVGGVTIEGVEDHSPIVEDKPGIETTNYGSGGYQEIQGLPRADDVTVSCQDDKNDLGQQALHTAFAAGTTPEFVFTFMTGRKVTFNAKVKRREKTNPLQDKNMYNFVLAPLVATIVWADA